MTKDRDNHWSLRALCRGKWDLFDSVDVDGKDVYLHEEEAKALCVVCPVRQECRASGRNEPTNIWAGEIKEAKK